MLYDRFDDMRSKQAGGGGGGEYDYDLTRLGTRISVTASSPILKGQKWKGTINPSGNYTFTKNSVTNPIIDYCNKDGSVGINTPNFLTNSLVLKFFETLNYGDYNVDISSVISQFNLDSSLTYTYCIMINEDGTLAVYNCYNSTSGDWSNKLLVLEIDKENKTAAPYVTTLEENHMSNNNIILFDDYILRKQSTNALALYKYDFNLHKFVMLSSGITDSISFMYSASEVPHPMSYGKDGNGNYFFTFNYSSSNGRKVFKINIVNSTITLSVATNIQGHSGTSDQRPYVSANGMYVVVTSSAGSYQYINLYGLNNDMTLSSILEHSMAAGDSWRL